MQTLPSGKDLRRGPSNYLSTIVTLWEGSDQHLGAAHHTRPIGLGQAARAY